MKVGDRVEIPNPEGATMFDQMADATIVWTDGVYFQVERDDGVPSPYYWVVDDGVVMNSAD